MTSGFTLTPDLIHSPRMEWLRRVLVLGSPLALILAGRPLPF